MPSHACFSPELLARGIKLVEGHLTTHRAINQSSCLNALWVRLRRAGCHVAEIPVADLWRKLPPFKRVAEIRIRCTRCGERDRVELDATKALGNDRDL